MATLWETDCGGAPNALARFVTNTRTAAAASSTPDRRLLASRQHRPALSLTRDDSVLTGVTAVLARNAHERAFVDARLADWKQTALTLPQATGDGQRLAMSAATKTSPMMKSLDLAIPQNPLHHHAFHMPSVPMPVNFGLPFGHFQFQQPPGVSYAASQQYNQTAVEHIQSFGELETSAKEQATIERAWLSAEEQQRLQQVIGNSAEGRSDLDANEELFQQNLWTKLSKDFEEMYGDDMASGDATGATVGGVDYVFGRDDGGLLKDVDNPYELGLAAIASGDIPTAVLLFERAIQRDPHHYNAWCQLGVAQQLNENDAQSLSALTRGMKEMVSKFNGGSSTFDISKATDSLPNTTNWSAEDVNLFRRSLMASGVSFANQSLRRSAVNALLYFLQFDPDLAANADAALSVVKRSHDYSLNSPQLREECRKVVERLRQVAESTGIDVDRAVDLRTCSGVLSTLTDDHGSAAVDFKAALDGRRDLNMSSTDGDDTSRPIDGVLWNRYGACLANDGRPEEAVHAYQRALQLMPGSIRTRYNMGVSCSQLDSREAACRHFLTALTKQMDSLKRYGDAGAALAAVDRTSETIWSSLRTNLLVMENSKQGGTETTNGLYSLALNKDINELNKVFFQTASST